MAVVVVEIFSLVGWTMGTLGVVEVVGMVGLMSSFGSSGWTARSTTPRSSWFVDSVESGTSVIRFNPKSFGNSVDANGLSRSKSEGLMSVSLSESGSSWKHSTGDPGMESDSHASLLFTKSVAEGTTASCSGEKSK